MAQLPVLPHGSSTVMSGLSETFSFHSSPEKFISSRLLALENSNPQLVQSRRPIRARVLNRNVAVISSYDQVQQCLCDESLALKLSSDKAYHDLMAPFFPPPNLLLLDPPEHPLMKGIWSERMTTLKDTAQPLVRDIVLGHFKVIANGSSIDLYDSMKQLSWQILLGLFLSQDMLPEALEIEMLQEQVLRGQFSLLPVSVNAKFWRSARSKGLEARKQLQSIFASRVIRGASSCPFATPSIDAKEDVASHLLLFTSSLAVKALASLLTATMMNLFLFQCSLHGTGFENSCAARIVTEDNEMQRSNAIERIVLETERLSPPVVGIMRQVTQDIILKPSDIGSSTLIPKNWDLWLYFVGAARDPSIFGEDADLFKPTSPDRQTPDGFSEGGFAYGAGPKSCLGKDLMRHIARVVLETCLGIDNRKLPQRSRPRVTISCDVNKIASGVQAWLGWRKGITSDEWARDMKQLPTQRPAKPVVVQVGYCENPS